MRLPASPLNDQDQFDETVGVYDGSPSGYNMLTIGRTGAAEKAYRASMMHLNLIKTELENIMRDGNDVKVDVYDLGLLETTYYGLSNAFKLKSYEEDVIEYLSGGIQYKTTIDITQGECNIAQAIRENIVSIDYKRVLLCVPKGKPITQSLADETAVGFIKSPFSKIDRIQTISVSDQDE